MDETERQPCLECGDWLDMTELEVGTGYCHICGHAEMASQVGWMRPLVDRLARACGFASLTAALEAYERMDQDAFTEAWRKRSKTDD